MSYRHLLVTGGAGFIGSNFIRLALARDTGLSITNLDLLTYSGNERNLEDVLASYGQGSPARYRFVKGDIGDEALVRTLLRGVDGKAGFSPVDAVVHFAAESHVDRSILGPLKFVETNVNGTTVLLEACRRELEEQARPFRFLHVSTDEVYGSLGPADPAFVESLPLLPNSPYAASKAGSDLMVRAYHETFGLPTLITRCSNNYGPYQFPEKLIPLMITRAMRDGALPIYGDGLNVRDWIFVDDHCDGILAVLHHGTVGRTYNLGGENEVSNLDLVRQLLAELGKPESLISYVTDRLGHDRRYAMDVARAREELRWAPVTPLADGLARTVAWYRANPGWWRPLLSETERLTAELYQA
jgi:dTDP-glucose 4,6-dehydratase